MYKYWNTKAFFRELTFWLSILVTRKRTVYTQIVKEYEDKQIEYNVEHINGDIPDSIYEEEEIIAD